MTTPRRGYRPEGPGGRGTHRREDLGLQDDAVGKAVLPALGRGLGPRHVEAGHRPLDGGLARLPGEAPRDVRVPHHEGGREVLGFGVHFGMNVTWSSGKRKAGSGDGERAGALDGRYVPWGSRSPGQGRERGVRRSPRRPVRRQPQPCTFVPSASDPCGLRWESCFGGGRRRKNFVIWRDLAT